MSTPTTPDYGPQLRAMRVACGYSLREVARRVGVSPSMLSQIETGKSKGSLTTLRSITLVLGMSLADLAPGSPANRPPQTEDRAARPLPKAPPVHIARPTILADAATNGAGCEAPPRSRRRLVTSSGVVWEQLTPPLRPDHDFLEVTYPPGVASTTDGRSLMHGGVEYGYLVEGTLDITVGTETHHLQAGDSFAFRADVPHVFRNLGTEPARFVAFSLRH